MKIIKIMGYFNFTIVVIAYKITKVYYVNYCLNITVFVWTGTLLHKCRNPGNDSSITGCKAACIPDGGDIFSQCMESPTHIMNLGSCNSSLKIQQLRLVFLATHYPHSLRMSFHSLDKLQWVLQQSASPGHQWTKYN